ncbi:MAG TPA: hypothetical protein VN207_02530 [Ktedonobacteraceae bacterium]|nr:hypothetical protein [Ktedonobacteraceae bacterium]
MNAGITTRASIQSRNGKSLHTLLRELSDDDEDTMADTGTDVPDDPQRPWLRDYRVYIDVPEQVQEGWTAIQWWGVSVPVAIS